MENSCNSVNITSQWGRKNSPIMSARGTSPPYSLGRIFGFTASFRSSMLVCSCNMNVMDISVNMLSLKCTFLQLFVTEIK